MSLLQPQCCMSHHRWSWQCSWWSSPPSCSLTTIVYGCVKQDHTHFIWPLVSFVYYSLIFSPQKVPGPFLLHLCQVGTSCWDTNGVVPSMSCCSPYWTRIDWCDRTGVGEWYTRPRVYRLWWCAILLLLIAHNTSRMPSTEPHQFCRWISWQRQARDCQQLRTYALTMRGSIPMQCWTFLPL